MSVSETGCLDYTMSFWWLYFFKKWWTTYRALSSSTDGQSYPYLAGVPSFYSGTPVATAAQSIPVDTGFLIVPETLEEFILLSDLSSKQASVPLNLNFLQQQQQSLFKASPSSPNAEQPSAQKQSQTINAVEPTLLKNAPGAENTKHHEPLASTPVAIPNPFDPQQQQARNKVLLPVRSNDGQQSAALSYVPVGDTAQSRTFFTGLANLFPSLSLSSILPSLTLDPTTTSKGGCDAMNLSRIPWTLYTAGMHIIKSSLTSKQDVSYTFALIKFRF